MQLQIKFSFVLLFLLGANNLKASDTIFVKFLNKKVGLEYHEVRSLVIGNRTYIFNRSNDSIVECYVLKNSGLICNGVLKIKENNGNMIALRQDYWNFFSKGINSSRQFYYNDNIFNEQFPEPSKKIVELPSTEYINLDKPKGRS
jgi:hypothetical protein